MESLSSTSSTIRLILQPDRRQQLDRRLVWRGGRRTSDAQCVADRRSAHWQDSEDDLSEGELASPICALS